jgi:hypothetical protein
MEHWFALLVVLSQVAVFHFYAVPCETRLMYQRVLDRNPAWIASHPEFTAANPPPKLSAWISYAIGLSLYVWLILAPSMDTETLVINAMMASVLLTLIHPVVYPARFHRMSRKVPPPEIREASLDRRALRDFLSPIWVYTAAGLIAAVIAVYAVALLADRIPEEVLFYRVSGLLIGCAALDGIIWYALRRKPTRADELFSGRFRCWKVRGPVAVLYLFVAVGTWRILGDVFDIHPLSEIGVWVALSIAVQVGWVWECKNRVSPIG